jgi:heme exporter protein CcmD
MTLQSFLEMGGYAAYVWSAWVLSLAAIAAVTLLSWRWMRRAERLAAASAARTADADPAARPPSEPID